MLLTPPRRSILRTLKAGDSVVFHHAAGRQWCQSMLTTIQSSLKTGRFSQRSAQIIDAGTIHDVTIVTCVEPIKGHMASKCRPPDARPNRAGWPRKGQEK